MPNIFVINRASHDYSGAERWGELKFLSEGTINRYATNRIYRLFSKVLASSKPEDYILLTGLTVMSVIACAIFAVKHKQLNLLIFRSNNHSYVERRLVLEEHHNES